MIFTVFGTTIYNDVNMANIFVNLNHYYNILKTEFDLREYQISGDDRPESLSNELYGDPNLYWVFFLINEITDPFYDWILSMNTTQTNIDYRWQFVGGGDQIDHHVDESGRQWFNVIEYPDGSKNWYSKGADGEADKFMYFGTMIPVTITEHQHNINEDKRNIKIVQPKDIRRFVDRLVALVRTYNDDIK